jgi:hypothetical protein
MKAIAIKINGEWMAKVERTMFGNMSDPADYDYEARFNKYPIPGIHDKNFIESNNLKEIEGEIVHGHIEYPNGYFSLSNYRTT